MGKEKKEGKQKEKKYIYTYEERKRDCHNGFIFRILLSDEGNERLNKERHTQKKKKQDKIEYNGKANGRTGGGSEWESENSPR